MLENVKEMLQNNRDLKPSQYYERFVAENVEIIEREKSRLGYEIHKEDKEDDLNFDINIW